MHPVYVTLNRWLGYTFEWGVRDCCLTPSDWIAERTGIDPVADVRGAYATAAECERVTRFFSDPMGAVAPRLAKIGLPVTDSPKMGDFGLIVVSDGRRLHPSGSIYCGEGYWGVLAAEGAAVVTPINVISSWSVP